MPEGDTIAYAAHRIRPVLVGAAPERIETPQPRHLHDRWPERLAGRVVTEVRTHGKHLFIAFEGDLVIHSHLRMIGSWGVYPTGGRWRRATRRAWLVLGSRGHEVVEFDGPVLELLTEGRTRFDRRLAELGPDVLASEFDRERFLVRLRADDQTRGIGDALLDQRNVAGIGNIWKSEGCWLAGIDPWRRVLEVLDEEAVACRRGAAAGDVRIGDNRPDAGQGACVPQGGRPCPRCGAKIASMGQGDDNRTTFWCPGCQR